MSRITKDRKIMHEELDKLGLSSNLSFLPIELFFLGFTSINQISEEFLDEILFELDPTYQKTKSFQTILGIEGNKNPKNYLYNNDSLKKPKKN